MLSTNNISERQVGYHNYTAENKQTNKQAKTKLATKTNFRMLQHLEQSELLILSSPLCRQTSVDLGKVFYLFISMDAWTASQLCSCQVIT